MPFYMDRHYVEGATAHAVAVAHTATLASQDRYRVRFLTYWFDDVRSTAFCLVDSPDKETVRQAHYEWHGIVLHEIIEVDPAVVEAFLGRVADPTPADPLHLENAIDAAFRAIMFTDLKDSTLMTSTLGDARALHLLHVSNVLTRNALRTYRGREIKHTGDGVMASFASVSDAVTCAVSGAGGGRRAQPPVAEGRGNSPHRTARRRTDRGRRRPVRHRRATRRPALRRCRAQRDSGFRDDPEHIPWAGAAIPGSGNHRVEGLREWCSRVLHPVGPAEGFRMIPSGLGGR
jgi:Protein of unknown function (DUF4242)